MILFIIHSFIYSFIYLQIRRKAKASEASLSRGDSPCSSFAFACLFTFVLFILLLFLFLLFLLLLLLCDTDATWRRCHHVSMCWVTLPRHSTAHRTSNRRRATSCTRYTSKSCASTQPSLSFSCFDGIIMRHTTSGCTYKRDVSRRRCFTPFHQVLLYCLRKVALCFSPNHAITIACRIEDIYAALLLPVALMAAKDHRGVS